jgi:hypothetical protein
VEKREKGLKCLLIRGRKDLERTDIRRKSDSLKSFILKYKTLGLTAQGLNIYKPSDIYLFNNHFQTGFTKIVNF